MAMFVVTEEQKKSLGNILLDYNLKLILLHGSYAKGTAHSDSDLDIAVLGRSTIDSKNLFAMYERFHDAFPDFSGDIDLKALQKVDPLFMYLVSCDSVLLAGSQSDYTDFKNHAFVSYQDSKSLRVLEKIMVHKYQTYLNNKYVR